MERDVGEDAREKIRRGLAAADAGDGVVILTDMFGGTPTNLALPFLYARSGSRS